jgi:glycosyltransferase involved in cell wall biosynthesis
MRQRLSGGRVDGPIILYVGRLSPEKSLESFTRVLRAFPHARIAFVGDGPSRKQLERKLRSRRVTFLGFLSGDELAAAFASADLFVMPSRTETLGFVVLEAMASGCAVVAARAGGIPDLVDHEETGLLYDPDDGRGMIEAIGDLLEHDGKRRFFARAARKRAEESSWRAETRRLVRAYSKAIVLQRSNRRFGRLGRIVAA